MTCDHETVEWQARRFVALLAATSLAKLDVLDDVLDGCSMLIEDCVEGGDRDVERLLFATRGVVAAEVVRRVDVAADEVDGVLFPAELIKRWEANDHA